MQIALLMTQEASVLTHSKLNVSREGLSFSVEFGFLETSVVTILLPFAPLSWPQTCRENY